MLLLLFTLAAPLVTALLGIAPLPRRAKELNLVLGLAATLALAVLTAQQLLAGRPPSAFDAALRVDGLSALMLVLAVRGV